MVHQWEHAKSTDAVRALSSMITCGTSQWYEQWSETEHGIPAVVQRLWMVHGNDGVTAAVLLSARHARYKGTDQIRVQSAQIAQWAIRRYAGHATLTDTARQNASVAKADLMRRRFADDIAAVTDAVAPPMAWQRFIDWKSAAEGAERAGLVVFIEESGRDLTDVDMFVCDDVLWNAIDVDLGTDQEPAINENQEEDHERSGDDTDR